MKLQVVSLGNHVLGLGFVFFGALVYAVWMGWRCERYEEQLEAKDEALRNRDRIIGLQKEVIAKRGKKEVVEA